MEADVLPAGAGPRNATTFYVVTTSDGGKDALAALQVAFAEYNEARPDKEPQWPLVELTSDSYINSFSKKIFFPIFDILDWQDPPANFQAVTPPPNTVAKIEHKPDFDEAADAATDKATAQPIGQDLNDAIPF
jgi:hypothetical protein